MLQDLRRLFNALRQRAATIRPGAMTSDAMYWPQSSAYRRCRPPASQTSCVSTKKRRALVTAADQPADRVAAAAEGAVAGAAAVERRDRFGLGWRPELAAGILAHLDRIDVIEVIAESYFDGPRRDLRAL